MKNSIFALIIALLIGITPVTIAAKIDVFPTGDPALDRTNLFAALAAAAPGDTILLRAGVFNLTPPATVTDPLDCSLDVAIPLPDGDSFRFWDAFAQLPDLCNPDATHTADFGLRNSSELYLIDKPLTIKGQANSTGPLTVLHVDNRFSDIYAAILEETSNPNAAFFSASSEADSYFLLVGASDVTIKNIEFDGPTHSIRTFWAGTSIKDCVFRAVGFGPFFSPDERSIYPNYPANFNDPTSSKFKNNVFIDAQQGIHISGSEVIVTDNVFDLYGAPMCQASCPW